MYEKKSEIARRREELIWELMTMEKEMPTGKVTTPSDVVPVLLKYAKRTKECFVVVSLDGEHKIIRTRVVSVGLLNRTVVHPREVYRGAIRDNAAAIIIAHNHPSGSLEPSKEDREVTERIKNAGEILGIACLDHIIVSKRGAYSFLSESRC